MTEAATSRLPDGESPAAALQQRFIRIQQQSMQGVPILNPALRVQALGFRHWDAHWLGVVVTPWFMNLVLFPRQRDRWPVIGERESRHYVFPAGVFEFIGNHDAELGDYQACSLFSPMFEFADQESAHDTAVAALAALFEPGVRQAAEVPDPAVSTAAPPVVAPTAAGAGTATVAALSKRDFLFGSRRQPSR